MNAREAMLHASGCAVGAIEFSDLNPVRATELAKGCARLAATCALVLEEDAYRPRPEAWFKERIGHRIYRDHYPGDCCSVCEGVAAHGLVIGDALHACYLADVDAEFAAEGVLSYYRDTPDRDGAA